MKRSLRRIMLIAVVVLLMAGAAVVVEHELREPPVSSYRRALDAIERVEAVTRNNPDIQEARRLLELGRESMAATSASWLPFVSYQEADSLFARSQSVAEAATAADRKVRRQVKERAITDLKRLRQSVADVREQLDDGLQRTNAEVLYRSLVFEADLAATLIKEEQFALSGTHLDRAFRLVDSLERLNQRYDDRLEEGSAQWSKWVEETIESSRSRGTTSLVVDKQAHRLYLIENGRMVDTFTCDLGYNAGIQKLAAGDGATPEGKYRVVHRNNQSKYYRALLLNYPNDSDRARFSANLTNGTIPSGSAIGGLIEIHGHGGTGRDWTDGCVAVTDADMDRLLKRVDIGTPVTIVRKWQRQK